MVAPYPYEAVAKRVALDTQARELLGHYTWLARWSDEIGKDAELDLKKLGQLALIHCPRFDAILAAHDPINGSSPLLVAFASVARQRGMVWADMATLASDVAALRSAAADLAAFVKANVPEAATVSTNVIDDQGRMTDTPKTQAKGGEAAEVAKLRALFGTTP